ncbi:22010_t:CDS:2 [Cetraspora pellucida]|uniref:22010_t:CDS:1 n=1 Tax=Cetraspora pellucida TaxID=1433469 RepID=A0A9N8WC79_9GLOM|nr:22010_t:CDS:2 [Cetraspora pellucida]
MADILSKPRHVSHTLYKLHDWIEKGMINVSPEFQRVLKTPDIKQSHLIDSILKNYYIPPVIFSCKKIDENRWTRICIDGKQRLTSIHRFMKNEIPHLVPSQRAVSKRYFSNQKGAKLISDTERELFECSEIVCIEYYDLTQMQEREIFSRVQLGISLTPAEKLWAISSTMSDFLHRTYETYKVVAQIMDTKRGKLFHVMAQLFFIIENEPEKFNARPKIIEKYLRNTREIPIHLQETIKRVFDTMKLLIEIDSDIFQQNHRLSPIEFVFIAWIIAKNPNISLAKYQECLLKMKRHVREHHEDTRFNDKVYSTLKKFMDNLDLEESNESSSDIDSPSKKRIKSM